MKNEWGNNSEPYDKNISRRRWKNKCDDLKYEKHLEYCSAIFYKERWSCWI